MPKDFILKHQLPSDRIEIAHFNELIKSQEDLELLLASKLRTDNIKSTNTFNKMRVNNAKNVFSTDVSSSLQFLADENHKPEFITTAWFVKNVSRWFSLMTSRNCKIALGLKNEEIYNANIKFLYEIIDLFKNIGIGKKEIFKPVQRGIILTTTSVINLVEYLLNKRNFQFVLIGRFTQDCIENLFSLLRHKNVIPDCLQFKNDLKLISVAMYMKSIVSGNYEEDDSEYLCGFLEYLSKTRKKDDVFNSSIASSSALSAITNKIPLFDSNAVINYNNKEMNSLYNIVGYCLKSVEKTCITYCNCIQSVGSKKLLNFPFSKLVRIKCYNNNTLYFINKPTFEVFLKLENIYRHYRPYFHIMREVNLHEFLVDKFNSIPADHILNCHNLRKKLFKKFAMVRLKFKNKHKNLLLQRKYYDSKSMAMHHSFK